ncbi:hypothetical protein FACS189416_7680 [Bacteroidia bacterium]|nr:hypothetical protein FACS189416_7680 [Bacteroidia bacterium]
METIKTKKEFDCIEMKNNIQAKIYDETKDMNFKELRAYIDNRLQNDSFWQRIVRNIQSSAPTMTPSM